MASFLVEMLKRKDEDEEKEEMELFFKSRILQALEKISQNTESLPRTGHVGGG